MKTSNRILLISGSSLIGIMILLLFLLRLMVGSSIRVETPTRPQQAEVTKEFQIEDFNEIKMEGRWGVEVLRGDTTRVQVKAPEDVMDALSIEKHALTLILKRKERNKRDLAGTKAFITLPSLRALRLKGLISLAFNGFESDTLSIRTTGVTTLTGTGNRIRDLSLRGEGLSNLDLGKNPVTNADLRYEGVYKVELTMAGGVLSGRIKGVGEIIYDGTVREERIEKEGPSKVTVRQ